MDAASPARKLRVALFVDTHWLFINTVQEYVESFDLYSRHDIEIFSAQPVWRNGQKAPMEPVSLEGFDVALIHYSARPCTGTVVPAIERALHEFRGLKVMMLQDEYEFTSRTIRWIAEHHINHVITAVPGPCLDIVFPPDKLPGVTFTSVLTGYVPLSLERTAHVRPLEERKTLIAYRGRPLGFQYGELGQDKINIGKHVRAVCEKRGLSVDIEWTEDKRIYGRDWNDFVQSARATLGTESGSNVFDMDGSIVAQLDAALKENPKLSYEEARGRFFTEENLGIKMNQISPKFFEFIAARTALILFEGQYSGILQPGRHYLPLRKDYSNLDEILAKLDDIALLKDMTERVHREVVASGRYSYRAFVKRVDDVLDQHVHHRVEDVASAPPLPSRPPVTRQLARLRQLRCSSIIRLTEELLVELKEKSANFSSMIGRRRDKIAKLQAKMDERAPTSGNTA